MPTRPVRMFSAVTFAPSPDGRLDPGELAQAADAGFAAAIWRAPLFPHDEERQALRRLASSCREAGLLPIIEIDPTRFPLDHPLVKSRPGAFAIRRSGEGSTPVDPRKELPGAGDAIARLREPDCADLLAAELTDRLGAFARLGVGGCRLTPGLRLSAGLARFIEKLIGRLAAAGTDLTLIAGPPGGDRGALAALGRAGCDYLVSSFNWWDLGAPWLLEEMEALSSAAPVLHELGPALASADPQVVRARLRAAGALGAGLIVPIGLARTVAESGALPAPVERERAGGGVTAWRLTGSSSPVTAILMPDERDVRSAAEATLLLINRTQEEQPLPAARQLSGVGGPFSVAMDAVGEPGDGESGASDDSLRAMLAPNEVRTIRLARDKAVLGKAARARETDLAAGLAAAPRLVIEDVEPGVAGGPFAVKRVVGDVVTVTATLFGDGHEQLAAELHWRATDERSWRCVPMEQLPNDRWRAEFPLQRLGQHEFRVEGWLDRFGGFRRDFGKKLEAGVAQPVDRMEGRALVEHALGRVRGATGQALKRFLARLDKADARADEEASAGLLRSPELARAMAAADDRPHAIVSPPQRVDAERMEARFSSWYELFPRSITPMPEPGTRPRHGTFADVIGVLPHIRDMGFDTLYFPPIHPIGRTNRKGPNNTLTPGPDDHGSPYAIGSEEGGHDAIHPGLGSFEDFARLVSAAREHGLEIALDFAIQCSPDHPWLREHPGWFAWRPDGSMKYAENPPKKYQDIVNVDFYAPDAIPALWRALRDVVLLWVGHGVKTFRVDNPHTKPLPFWEWMIGEVRSRHPEVIFLSEAFTRPTMMYRLAKVGFSQSYTYFTWRDTKHELVEYFTELTTTAPKEFYRPHLFVNTPDINPFYLQTSGRPGFRIRAVLAATLSGLFGVYSGFELCEYEPLGAGKEEYLDSEKYEIRPRPLRTPGDIVDDITLLNRLRRAHPALQTHLNTRFYTAHNDSVIWYGKPHPPAAAATTAGTGDPPDEMIMVMVNLDPHHPQECAFEVPLWEFGLPDDAAIAVEDLASGHRFEWHGKMQAIRLAPDEPWRIWRLSRAGGEA